MIDSSETASKIAIVDDHPIVRQGLGQLIACQDDMTVCGEAEDIASALEMIQQTSPDLLVLDIALPDGSGVDLIEQLKVSTPHLPILVLSMHDESFYAERVLRAGARGYITKSQASESVIEAIRKIIGGQLYLSEKTASRMLARLVGTPSTDSRRPIDRLTNRELQIYEFIGVGMATRLIAKKLHISAKTVESHRENIKRKLNVASASELLQHAIKWVQTENIP